VALALIKALGLPIVGTSANPSGRPAARSAAEVHAYFGDRIDLIIDGGGRPGGRESTIVDISQPGPRLLREGAISRREIERLCPLE
jgi:L-threonylcarbamoyladenylate synthase